MLRKAFAGVSRAIPDIEALVKKCFFLFLTFILFCIIDNSQIQIFSGFGKADERNSSILYLNATEVTRRI